MSAWTDVVGVIVTPCDGGCDKNVEVWNELAETGFGVIVVTGAIETDARLFRSRTGATFPVVAFEGEEFLELFRGSHVGWTLLVDESRVVTHAYEGRLSDAESILSQLGGQH